MFILLAHLTLSQATSSTASDALVVSGGVSLGAYQAGALFYLAQHQTFGTATGASAGNINAALLGLHRCRQEDKRDTDLFGNIFFDTWINIGIDKLAPETLDEESYRDLFRHDIGSEGYRSVAQEVAKGSAANTSPYAESNNGLFTRSAFAAAEANVKAKIEADDFEVGCSFKLGITVTKAIADRPEIQGIKVAVQRRVVPLQLSVPDNTLRITTSTGTIVHGRPLYLPGDINADDLLQVVRASSAFPVAFGPVELSDCQKLPCADQTPKELFLDGGLFDNVPLSLAHELAPQAPRFWYVESDVRRARKTQIKTSVAPQFNVGNIITEARQYEIQAVARFNPTLAKKVKIVSRYYEIPGGYLGNFGAFLHRDLRIHDYLIGYYDAVVADETTLQTKLDPRPNTSSDATLAHDFLLFLAYREKAETLPSDDYAEAACQLLAQDGGAPDATVAQNRLNCGSGFKESPLAAWSMFKIHRAFNPFYGDDPKKHCHVTDERDPKSPEPPALDFLGTLACLSPFLAPARGSEFRLPGDIWGNELLYHLLDRAKKNEVHNSGLVLAGVPIKDRLTQAQTLATFLLERNPRLQWSPAAGKVNSGLWQLAPNALLWDITRSGFRAEWAPGVYGLILDGDWVRLTGLGLGLAGGLRRLTTERGYFWPHFLAEFAWFCDKLGLGCLTTGLHLGAELTRFDGTIHGRFHGELSLQWHRLPFKIAVGWTDREDRSCTVMLGLTHLPGLLGAAFSSVR